MDQKHRTDNYNMESSIKRAVEAETPDMLESLLAECGLAGTVPGAAEPDGADAVAEKRTVVPDYEERQKIRFLSRKNLRRLSALAAVLALVLIGAGAYNRLLREPVPVAMVGMDVNPSIELYLDSHDKVISCSAVNADGEAILKDLDLKGTDVHVAAYSLIGAMLTKGYLTDSSNSVLLSVTADDPKRGTALERELSENLSGYMENSIISAAVFGQYIDGDDDLKSFAAENGISIGKAWIIRALAAKNPRLTEASLLKLSTQELLLLWDEKGEADPELVSAFGNVNTSRYITREEAAEIAFKHAGVDRADVAALDIQFDCEDGIIIYEVEFVSGGREYEIEMRAETGEILTQESEAADPADMDRDDDDDDDRYEKDDDRDDAEDRYEQDDDADDADDRYEKDDDDDREDDDDDDRFDRDDDDD